MNFCVLGLSDYWSQDYPNPEGDTDVYTDFPHSSSIPSPIMLNGEEMNLTLEQSLIQDPSTLIISNMSDPTNNSLSLDCPIDPTFNSSFINISLEDIQAHNKTITVDDGADHGPQELDSGYSEITSFTVNYDCYLENITIELDNQGTGNGTISVRIYNSSWDGGATRSKPNGGDFSGDLVGSINALNNTKGWYTLENVHHFLNLSLTENNTWFIGLTETGAGADTGWEWTADNFNGNNSMAFYYDNLVLFDWVIRYEGIIHFSTWDYHMKVGVSPNNNTPNPEDINMRINDTLVTGYAGVNGSGYWANTSVYSSASGKLNFTFSAEWYQVSCNISEVRIDYSKTDLKTTSSINLNQNFQLILWNVTSPGGLDFFDQNLTNYTVNFTIPVSWSNYSVFNGATNKTDDISDSFIVNNYRTIKIANAGNGTYWHLNATSNNYLQSINTYKKGTSTVITEALNNQIIEFNATFSQQLSQNDGDINLTAYSPDSYGNNLAFTNQSSTFPSGINISIGEWDISTVISEFGIYRIQAFWYNTTEAGFREATFTINNETSGTEPNGNGQGDPDPPIDPILIILIIVVPIGLVALVILLFLRGKDEF